ncbi:MAG: chromosomal replication initiator protein DnaA [Candidatus Midichloria sp.]|nr:MAG: chromosomal replication initiator protein DnaA [Candidatus Midichloria sp.]
MDFNHLPHNLILDKNRVDEGIFVYNALFEKIKEEYGNTVFTNWFSHISFKSLSDQTLTIAAPSKFVREWVILNYFTKIYKILELFNGLVKRIDIIVETSTSSIDLPVLSNNQINKIEEVTETDKNDFSFSFDNRFSFENFTVGSSNKMAFSAAQNMAGFNHNWHSSAINCNTLFIHGAVGMGKTHLLYAIANRISKNYPGKSICYLSAEKFMHRYMMAVRKNELINFKENLRSLDILLFDDLQFICDKSSTQKEFANTVNALIESNKKMVIACDRSPYNLDLDPRTKSRVASGVVAEIQAADFDLRLNILKQKSDLMQITIKDEILSYLATSISSNIRELEGSLNKLVTYCSLNEMPITLGTCKNTLKDCIKAHEQDVSVAKIIQAVAELNAVTKAEILSKSRLAKLVYLRQMVAFLAKEITKSSLQEIGKQLGGKNHATIIYYMRQFEQKIERRPAIKDELDNIKNFISN